MAGRSDQITIPIGPEIDREKKDRSNDHDPAQSYFFNRSHYEDFKKKVQQVKLCIK